MTEIERILDQLRRAYEGEAWHGPSVHEVLNGVTAAQAHERPLRNAHSIWELVQHIAVWADVGSRRLTGARPQIGISAPELSQQRLKVLNHQFMGRAVRGDNPVTVVHPHTVISERLPE